MLTPEDVSAAMARASRDRVTISVEEVLHGLVEAPHGHANDVAPREHRLAKVVVAVLRRQ